MSGDGCVNAPFISDAGAVLEKLHAQAVAIDELTVCKLISVTAVRVEIDFSVLRCTTNCLKRRWSVWSSF